jgi:signal transduction histidine kinase
MHLRIPILLKRLLLCLAAVTSVSRARELPLADVAELRALSPEAVALRPAVRVRAVVTFVISHPAGGRAEVTNFTVQEGGTGIWVNLERARRDGIWTGDETGLAALHEGALVEVEGLLAQGGLAPNILPSSVRVVGEMPLPQARVVALDRLMSGAEIAQRVIVSGVVQRCELFSNHWWMRVETPVGHLFVEATDGVALDPSALVDAEVQVEGLAASVFTWRKDFSRPRLRISRAESVVVTRAPPDDPFAAEEVSVKNLRGFSAEGRLLHRRRIEGTVTYYEPGTVLYLQDNGRAVRVETSSVEPLQVGDRVEATGFIDVSGMVAGLSGALFRKTGTDAAAEPVATTLAEVQSASFTANGQSPGDLEYDGLLVKLSGRVLGAQGATPGGPMRLVLDCDGTETTASLAGGSLAALPVGTLVSASGVAMLRYAPSDLVAEFSKPTRLDLLLRDGSDIAVIQAAPWWTARRALIALGVMLLVAAAALAWSMALGRTVRRQTAVIRDQLSRETLLQERTRMARELHDTVEQELMGLSLQLEAAGDTLPDSPDTAQRALLTGQALLKHTRAEVRRSIWDLRAPEFERRDLETAVRETVGPLSSPGGPEISVEVTGNARRMPGAVEVHLLRIASEAVTNAVKHAAARRIVAALEFTDRALTVRIRDDGRGFDSAMAMKLSGMHFGLLGIKERAQRIGGALELTSTAGNGTEIVVRVPIETPTVAV